MNKRKQKIALDKGFQEDIREVKTLISEGKAMLQSASSELDYTQALQIFSKAITKISTVQVANNYLLYYYRGICYMNLKQYIKAERDYMEGQSIADVHGKIQFFNALGKCKTQMSIEDPSYIDEAIKNYQQALKLSENKDIQAFISLGNIYKSMKHNSLAIQTYTNALKLIKSISQLFDVHMNRGICYRQLEQYQNSSKDFITANQIRKDNAQAYFNLGINGIMQQNYNKALEYLEQAIDISPNMPYYLNYKALALYNLDQLQSSLSVFKDSINMFQSKKNQIIHACQTFYNMGNCFLKMNRLQQALKSFQMSADLCQNDQFRLQIYYSEGICYEELKEQKSAIQKFKNTNMIIGDKTYHKLYLSTLYHLAINYSSIQDYQSAINYFGMILQRQSDQKQVYLKRGITYMNAQMYDQAQKDFQSILKLDEQYPQAYFCLGKTKTYLGAIDSAIADFFKAMELGSRQSHIIDGIACAYLKSQNPEKALVYSNIALNKNPNHEQYLIHRAMIYIQLQQFIKAISDLTNSLKISQNNPFIYYQRGISYYKSKQFQKAIQDLNKALQLNPANRIQGDIYYLTGISYANLQKYSEALSPLTSAITYNQLPKYYHERAKCYLILDQSQKALQDLNEVIRKQPDNAFAYFRRGLAQKALKRYEDAADSFMKAREIDPDDPLLVLNKKKIYETKYRKLCEAGQQK